MADVRRDMPVPDPNAPATRRLIEKLSPGFEPFQVMIDAPVWARELDCIDIVRGLVKDRGGECVLGWALWEWPQVVVEGEFHAVWKRPDGSYTDPTPRRDGDTFVLFLPDPKAVVDTWQKDNVRLALTNRREVLDFIDIKERIHRAKNRGGEAYSPVYTLTPHLEYLLREEAKVLQRLITRFGPRLCSNPVRRMLHHAVRRTSRHGNDAEAHARSASRSGHVAPHDESLLRLHARVCDEGRCHICGLGGSRGAGLLCHFPPGVAHRSRGAVAMGIGRLRLVAPVTAKKAASRPQK